MPKKISVIGIIKELFPEPRYMVKTFKMKPWGPIYWSRIDDPLTWKPLKFITRWNPYYWYLRWFKGIK